MKEMSYIADKFEELGVVPVVVLENTKDALPLAKALMEGGLPCAEVTFRTEAIHSSYGTGISRYVSWSRNSSYNKTG